MKIPRAIFLLNLILNSTVWSGCTLPGLGDSDDPLNDNLPAFVAILAGTAPGSSSGDSSAADTGTPGKTLFVGHSMIGHQLPGMLDWVVQNDGRMPYVGRRQMIFGASLFTNYVHHAKTDDADPGGADSSLHGPYLAGRFSTKGADARVELATGTYSALVFTDEHCLTASMGLGKGWATLEDDNDDCNETFTFANVPHTWSQNSGAGFYTDAVNANGGARIFLYENWFSIRMAAGAQTLERLNRWLQVVHDHRDTYQGIADEINALRGETLPSGNAVTVIPAGSAMSVLARRICANEIPGVTDPYELFSDNVHPSNLGYFFTALIHFYSLYGQSVTGVTFSGQPSDAAGNVLNFIPDVNIPQATLTALQNTARDVMENNAYTVPSTLASCNGLP